jgi:transketolase
MSDMFLSPKIGSPDIDVEPNRKGFGRGLKKVGDSNENVVALCADLTDSTQMSLFRDAHPDRFIEVGIAEQNLVTVASGMAHMGKIPFTSSYAAFSPGRNWEQIRTTVCLNEQPVKIVGSHAGLFTGADGATHQMLEDIALMRVLPHMVVVIPADAIEAEKATLAIAENQKPSYIRLAREAVPTFTTEKTPFEIGKAYVLRSGRDITLFGTGPMTYQCLLASEELAKMGIDAEVVHVPTIKPIDEETILASVRKTGRALSIEEAQIAGGFGSTLAELFSEKHPISLRRMGMQDHFGESGKPEELFEHFGLTAEYIVKNVKNLVNKKAE